MTLIAGCAAVALADDARLPDDVAPREASHYKLTLGAYHFDDRSAGADANLRRSIDWGKTIERGSIWAGYYRDPSFGAQLRGGADASWRPIEGVDLAIQPSAQLASRGFAGGSITAEYGVPWFASIGIGRTNLKPYWNLNFDPNDAISLAAGYRGRGGITTYLQVIRDDRLGTGQQHVHAVLRLPIGRDRLTLDLLRKQGEGEEGYVRAWGWSIGYDWPRFFVRIARDPKVNFSADNMSRISFGIRF